MTYGIFNLAGQVAVVTGGTSGIGRALSLGLAEAGADVVATARSRDAVESTAAEIERRGRRALRAVCDVTDRGSLERLLAEIVAAFGRIDILVNCAGSTRRTPTLEVGEAEWNAILDVNLTGTLRACQIFGKPMLDRGRGRIVNIASLSASVAFFEVAAYGASKAGVVALTRSLAVEWGRRGVSVNAISPGVFPTPLNRELLETRGRGKELLLRTPMSRFGAVEEVVGACVYLCSDAASFVNGAVLVVDGGFLASGVNQ